MRYDFVYAVVVSFKDFNRDVVKPYTGRKLNDFLDWIGRQDRI